ncbi:Cellobiose phosphorylase [Pontiella desulfatans]|uniref:Cellobiose phosphorylase n=1 Tax=Pontiella desulfatans TaxID=2750659 RepID=A0A6C2UBG7_PONDE|nr:hypothetical protein [Pontiella desulfatans]VGO17213.1 Cellobiose phosphorylase [Pontiella desulfatans]
MTSIEQYGRFIPEEGCFELTAPPPRKWINLHYNLIGDNEIYSEITNIGDGRTVCRDHAGNTCVLVDWDHKYCYIRDEKSGTVFCPGGEPAPQQVDNVVTKYYPAKTITTGECIGLKVEQRVFVPLDHPMEVRTVWVENATAEEREVSVFMYAMFQLNGCDSESNTVWKDNLSFIEPEINGVLVVNRHADVPTGRYKGYVVALNHYHGASGYRDYFTRSDFSLGTPKILWGWDADNKPGMGPDCAGVVQVKIKIPAGAKGRADFLLGQTSSLDEVKGILQQTNEQTVDGWCAAQEAAEAKRTNAFTVDTGNENWDGLLNTFVKKQLYSYLLNKAGFRDNLQCDCALALCDYEAAKGNLLRALSSQYANGSVPHGFRPLNDLLYSDQPAWIFLTVPWLIKESGDFSLLDETVPYLGSDETGTVWDHMLRAMRYLANDTGANALCDQHYADWNDGLEATKEAGDRESVMVTMQFCFGMKEFVELAQRRGDSDVAGEAQGYYDTFAARLNDVAWDGEWYVRTICGDGYRIGSAAGKEGRIFMNTQSWAVLAGVASDERAELCMAAVDEHCEKEVGFQVCAPGFSKYDPRVGRNSGSLPGTGENGGCYNHAAGFKAVADCMMGRAEEAWRTFEKVAPDNPLNPVSNSECEPFSFNNFYVQVPGFMGKSGYPWRTGTSGWFTMLMVEWILGARRHYGGLLIDPCLPKHIKSAGIQRTYRGTVFNIKLDNTSGRCKGAVEIRVDGIPMVGNLLTCIDGGTHEVHVMI